MHLRTPLALSLCTALLLSGCGGKEPEPKFEAEPSSTPTPSVAKQETAEEFIRRWNDEQTRMQKGDTTEYRRIADKCEPCMTAADQIDGIYAAGGFVKTDGRTIKSIESVSEEQGSRSYRVTVTSAPTEYQEKAGASIRRFKGGPAVYDVSIYRDDREWKLGFYLKASKQ